MQSILIVFLCCVCYEVTAQTANRGPITSTLPPKSDWEELTTSNHQLKESNIAKRDKFSSVLNLLKNALADELQNSYCLTEDTSPDNVSFINRITEEKQSIEDSENQIEKPILKNENETNAINTYQKVEMKSPSDYSNLTNEHKNVEMPNMIPIFKPRQRIRNEPKQNIADFSITSAKKVPVSKAISFVPEKIVQTVMSPISSQTGSNHKVADNNIRSSPIISNSKQTSKSRAVSFVPEKIVQTNMSPIPSQAMFHIPCQRAADVLDMSVVVPKKEIIRNTYNIINPIANTAKPILLNQIPAPVECTDEDDTVAMLFKPKNISLKQVYGNLLKKITITVLVPYHMSKLGAIQKI